MMRDSSALETANAMRLGMLAFIRPVMTSADGAARGNNEVHTGSAAHLGDAADALFHLFGGGHHKIGQLVDHDDNTRYRRLAEAGLVGIGPLRSRTPISEKRR